MKTKFWIILLSGLLLLCLALSLFLLTPGQAAHQVEVWSDGTLLYALPLSQPREITVQSQFGENTITIQDGKVAVTQADCPDHYCMDRGFCDSGVQIVCLPNRLVLKFTDSQPVDGVAGQ